jgi:hypothetical protein
MELIQLHENCYFLCLKRAYTWNEFRIKSKVKTGSYSESFAQNLFHLVFQVTSNLINEYKDYYADEYDTLEKYLFWRHGISEEILDRTNPLKYGYCTVVDFNWRLDESKILRESIFQLFSSLENGL